MSNLVKFELNTAGVRELLLSQEVAGACESVAAARCPEGCIIDTMAGKNRMNIRIVTDTDEAYKDNLNNNTLLEAIS